MLIDYKILFHRCIEKQDFTKAYKLAAWGETERTGQSSIFTPFLWWKLWLRMWGL
jgi:hypothetical protein